MSGSPYLKRAWSLRHMIYDMGQKEILASLPQVAPLWEMLDKVHRAWLC